MDDEAARLEFLAQAEELTDALFAGLRLLRAARTGRERRALLDRAFRHAHTLKGSAAALAHSGAVVILAHALEDLLDAARAGRVALDAPTLNACESAADSLAAALDAHSRGGQLAEPAAAEESARRLRELLHEAEKRAASAAADFSAPPPDFLRTLPEEIAAQLNAAELRRLAAAVGEGARVVSVRSAFELDQLDEGFRRLGDALSEAGEIIATLPGAPEGPGDRAARVSLRLVCATDEPPESLARRLAGFAAEVELLFDADSTAGRAGDGSVGVGNEPAVAAGGGAQNFAGPHEFVRVPLSELDELAFAASELFDDTTAALDAARSAAGGDVASAEIEGAAARLRQNFLALEERVLALRMQTLGPALERAARSGHAAARAAGKQIEIETSGGHARVDRALAEQIAEPLVHLLRNAVDHGIEPAAGRRAAGKAERGSVRLRAVSDGASVRVTVEDDGRGVDPAGVERVARAAGLVAEGARITEEQALRLIFRPGFSTSARVTETSGRGVGLDAVERAVERAGGEVRVRTHAGLGTAFELRLPLALALVLVVLVESDGETYAIDAARVVETGRLESSSIIRDGAGVRVVWRGRELPFVSLDALLGRAGGGDAGDGETKSFVLASLAPDADEDAREEGDGVGDLEGVGAEAPGGAASRLVAVAVDRVAGRRDALVRGLGRHATRWRGVGGAIDLRDGSVALLLDFASLIARSRGGR